MSRRRGRRPFVPVRLAHRRAEVHWENLAHSARVDDTCDERSRAKLAKVRKRAWRNERRAMRTLLRRRRSPPSVVD